MGDCKKVIATAREVIVNVRDGSKTAVSTFKEISTNLKTVSLAAKAPLKCFEVNLKGLGEESIPEPTLFRYNEDNTKASEISSKILGKHIAELSSATEVLCINAAKVFTEFQTNSDNLLLVTDWIREINDDLQNQVTVFASFGKVLVDHQLVIDTVAKSVATSFSNSSLATDMVAGTFQTPKQDAFAASDSVTFSADFRPIIQDCVYSTDDVLGNANIDDDQYMLFNKALTESSTAIEEVASSLDKLVSGTAADGTGDSQSVSDVFEKTLDVIAYESDYFLGDYVQRGYILPSLSTYDTATLDLSKQANDTGRTTDTIVQEASFYRSFVSTTTSASVALISISKELNESIAPIEAIAKSAGISLTDSAEVPDVLRKSLAASRADVAVMSDACTANLHNYMSALYVNAGYVGISYTL